jgi:hypothetical protein
MLINFAHRYSKAFKRAMLWLLRNMCGGLYLRVAPRQMSRTLDGKGFNVAFTKVAMKTAIGAAGIASVTIFTAATAAAVDPTVQRLGSTEQLVDGPLVTAYTVSNLQQSNVTLPVIGPQGQIWQADVTAAANSGTVTPLVADFNARAADGTNYRVIEEGTPDGLSPAPIVQGGQSVGKIYFNVTGTPPNSVVYNDGVEDVLIWTAS